MLGLFFMSTNILQYDTIMVLLFLAQPPNTDDVKIDEQCLG